MAGCFWIAWRARSQLGERVQRGEIAHWVGVVFVDDDHVVAARAAGHAVCDKEAEVVGVVGVGVAPHVHHQRVRPAAGNGWLPSDVCCNPRSRGRGPSTRDVSRWAGDDYKGRNGDAC